MDKRKKQIYLESARKMIANEGDCSPFSTHHINCCDCFYNITSNDESLLFHPLPICCGFSHPAQLIHVRDAKAFIARYEMPCHIELEGLE